MDQVEGSGVENIENWQTVFTGPSLSFSVTAGLVAKYQYRFRVRAISEYQKESPYSQIASFYAAALPEQITLPSDPFTEIEKTSLKFTWDKPSLDSATQLDIISYRVYWDAGYL